MKSYFAWCLVISLGLIIMGAFLKPWLPSWLHAACLSAYEPRILVRLSEAYVGLIIFFFGLAGAIDHAKQIKKLVKIKGRDSKCQGM